MSGASGGGGGGAAPADEFSEIVKIDLGRLTKVLRDFSVTLLDHTRTLQAQQLALQKNSESIDALVRAAAEIPAVKQQVARIGGQMDTLVQRTATAEGVQKEVLALRLGLDVATDRIDKVSGLESAVSQLKLKDAQLEADTLQLDHELDTFKGTVKEVKRLAEHLLKRGGARAKPTGAVAVPGAGTGAGARPAGSKKPKARAHADAKGQQHGDGATGGDGDAGDDDDPEPQEGLPSLGDDDEPEPVSGRAGGDGDGDAAGGPSAGAEEKVGGASEQTGQSGVAPDAAGATTKSTSAKGKPRSGSAQPAAAGDTIADVKTASAGTGTTATRGSGRLKSTTRGSSRGSGGVSGEEVKRQPRSGGGGGSDDELELSAGVFTAGADSDDDAGEMEGLSVRKWVKSYVKFLEEKLAISDARVNDLSTQFDAFSAGGAAGIPTDPIALRKWQDERRKAAAAAGASGATGSGGSKPADADGKELSNALASLRAGGTPTATMIIFEQTVKSLHKKVHALENRVARLAAAQPAKPVAPVANILAATALTAAPSTAALVPASPSPSGGALPGSSPSSAPAAAVAPKKEMCDRCSGYEAAWFCVDCVRKLCASCDVDAHRPQPKPRVTAGGSAGATAAATPNAAAARTPTFSPVATSHDPYLELHRRIAYPLPPGIVIPLSPGAGRGASAAVGGDALRDGSVLTRAAAEPLLQKCAADVLDDVKDELALRDARLKELTATTKKLKEEMADWAVGQKKLKKKIEGFEEIKDQFEYLKGSLGSGFGGGAAVGGAPGSARRRTASGLPTGPNGEPVDLTKALSSGRDGGSGSGSLSPRGSAGASGAGAPASPNRQLSLGGGPVNADGLNASQRFGLKSYVDTKLAELVVKVKRLERDEAGQDRAERLIKLMHDEVEHVYATLNTEWNDKWQQVNADTKRKDELHATEYKALETKATELATALAKVTEDLAETTRKVTTLTLGSACERCNSNASAWECHACRLVLCNECDHELHVTGVSTGANAAALDREMRKHQREQIPGAAAPHGAAHGGVPSVRPPSGPVSAVPESPTHAAAGGAATASRVSSAGSNVSRMTGVGASGAAGAAAAAAGGATNAPNSDKDVYFISTGSGAASREWSERLRRSDVRLAEFARKLNKVMGTVVRMDTFRQDVEGLTAKHTSLHSDLLTLARYADRTYVPVTRYQQTISELMLKLLTVQATVDNDQRPRIAKLEHDFALDKAQRNTVRDDTVALLRKFEKATTRYVFSEIRKFEKDVHILLMNHAAAAAPGGGVAAAGGVSDALGITAAGRMHFRCLACDSLLTPPPPTNIARPPDSDSYFDVSNYLGGGGGGGGGGAPGAAPLVHTHTHHAHVHHSRRAGGGDAAGAVALAGTAAGVSSGNNAAALAPGAPLPAMTMVVERGEELNLKGRDGHIYRGREDSNVVFVTPKKGKASGKFTVAYAKGPQHQPIKGLTPPTRGGGAGGGSGSGSGGGMQKSASATALALAQHQQTLQAHSQALSASPSAPVLPRIGSSSASAAAAAAAASNESDGDLLSQAIRNVAESKKLGQMQAAGPAASASASAADSAAFYESSGGDVKQPATESVAPARSPKRSHGAVAAAAVAAGASGYQPKTSLHAALPNINMSAIATQLTSTPFQI